MQRIADENVHRRQRTLARRAGLAALCCAVLTAGLILFWPHHPEPTPPTPVSLVDTYHRACILADPGDPNLPTADTGLQQAAKTDGDIDVQNYPTPDATTNATPYLSALISNKCTLILALGAQPDAAVDTYAANNPKTTLKLITIGQTASTNSSVTALPTTGLTAQTISTLAEGDFSQ